jgi:hypothetical protein
VNQWVADTAKMGVAHLGDLFKRVCILGHSYEDAIASLKSMREKKVSSQEDSGKNIGFGGK